MECVEEFVEGFDYTECSDDTCSKFKPLIICYLKDGERPADLPVLFVCVCVCVWVWCVCVCVCVCVYV